VAFQYISFHPLTRQQLAPAFKMSGVSWSETVNGNGTFSGTIAMPDDDVTQTMIKVATEPDESAIFIRNTATNNWDWCGVVTEQEWDRSKNTIVVTAVEFRSWPYQVFLGPKLDLTGDNAYGWAGVDQLTIARDIITYATTGGITDGRPQIAIGDEVSGKVRDLNIKGLDFKYAGELLDTISTRDGGFEWYLEPRTSAVDGLPELVLRLYFPQRGGIIDGLLFKSTDSGGNLVVDGSIKKSSTERRTRIWTVGSTETSPFAVDSDPAIPSGYTLLRERLTNYSTVTNRTTLASHARAERLFRSPKLNLLTVKVTETNPDVSTYRTGDRGRLILKDRMYDLDLPSVRIISREITPASGAGVVKLTLDLNDFELPEVDAGGAV
jgi:hypothetical protein